MGLRWLPRSWERLEWEEEQIREALRGMSEDRRAEYHRKISKLLKDPDTYAVLAYTFVGLHHFYLNEYFNGVVNMVGFVGGIACLFLGMGNVGIPILAIILILELTSLFWSQRIVHQHNNDVSYKLLEDIEPSLRLRQVGSHTSSMHN